MPQFNIYLCELCIKTGQRYVEVKNVALHVKINQTHQDIEIVSTSLSTAGKYFWTPKLT